MFVSRFSIMICVNFTNPVDRDLDVKKRDRSGLVACIIKGCKFDRFKFAILSRRDDNINLLR